MFSNQGVENEDLVVIGNSKSAVANSCSRILLIVESARSKLGPTHFISIPLNSKEMQGSFLDFKKDVLALAERTDDGTQQIHSNNRRIDETIFQTPSLLHLTIGTLALMGEY